VPGSGSEGSIGCRASDRTAIFRHAEPSVGHNSFPLDGNRLASGSALTRDPSIMILNRRKFLLHSTLMAAAAAAAPRSSAAEPLPQSSSVAPGTEPVRPGPLDLKLVKSFIGAAHHKLDVVKEMLAQEPRLIHASYDWGGGDWETALAAAGHTGQRSIAEYLLEAGARFESCCAAMLGLTDVVQAMIKASPRVTDVRGPHRYSLMYHIGYSGDIGLAETAVPHLAKRGADCNQALESATLSGHRDLVRWLLDNGVDNPNVRNFARKTPLDIAVEKGFKDIAALLEKARAVRGAQP
jgi:hypothetical protein